MKLPKLPNLHVESHKTINKNSDNKTLIFAIIVFGFLLIASFVKANEEISSYMTFFEKVSYIWNNGWSYFVDYALWAVLALVAWVLITHKSKNNFKDD